MKILRIIFWVLTSLCLLLCSASPSWGVTIFLVVLAMIFGTIAEKIGKREATTETDKTIFYFLLAASAADGILDPREHKYVQQYTKRRGLSDRQCQEVIDQIKNNSEFKYKFDIEQKMRIIDEIVGLIKSDGEVTEKEKEFLINVAGELKVDKEKVLAKL